MGGKISLAIDTIGLLGRMIMHLLDAIRSGKPERVDEILPAKDRARLHLLDLEARARAELEGETAEGE